MKFKIIDLWRMQFPLWHQACFCLVCTMFVEWSNARATIFRLVWPILFTVFINTWDLKQNLWWPYLMLYRHCLPPRRVFRNMKNMWMTVERLWPNQRSTVRLACTLNKKLVSSKVLRLAHTLNNTTKLISSQVLTRAWSVACHLKPTFYHLINALTLIFTAI